MTSTNDFTKILADEYRAVLKELIKESITCRDKMRGAKTQLKKDYYRNKLKKIQRRIQDLSLKVGRLTGVK
jgi:hypothetical protein